MVISSIISSSRCQVVHSCLCTS